MLAIHCNLKSNLTQSHKENKKKSTKSNGNNKIKLNKKNTIMTAFEIAKPNWVNGIGYWINSRTEKNVAMKTIVYSLHHFYDFSIPVCFFSPTISYNIHRIWWCVMRFVQAITFQSKGVCAVCASFFLFHQF